MYNIRDYKGVFMSNITKSHPINFASVFKRVGMFFENRAFAVIRAAEASIAVAINAVSALGTGIFAMLLLGYSEKANGYALYRVFQLLFSLGGTFKSLRELVYVSDDDEKKGAIERLHVMHKLILYKSAETISQSFNGKHYRGDYKENWTPEDSKAQMINSLIIPIQRTWGQIFFPYYEPPANKEKPEAS